MPILAQIDLSLNMAARPIAKIKGGPITIRIPARNPRAEPQPKPGIQSPWATTKIQGDHAKPKLIFPILVELVRLCSMVITSRIRSGL